CSSELDARHARLILILANHIGDNALLEQALQTARLESKGG
ncbi:MAG TPA: DUF2783 domain-containing protein, partial [Aliiroseovarius sp.]|nr:DUF2783 domain-containing protein [Aliiroseovarius sp.]